MSAVRLLALLLAVALVFCAFAPAFLRAGDPVISCFTPLGDPSYGVWTNDVGYYHLVGFESYAAPNYNVLCAFRALYINGPNGLMNTYGPWHGNNKANLDICTSHFESEFELANDWAQAGAGSFVTRTDNATGKLVVVQLQLGAVCSYDYICAGICPGSANYAANMAAPTVQRHNFTSPAVPAGAAAPMYVVYVTLNTTSAVNTPVNGNSPSYPTTDLSVISSIQLCEAYIGITCPS